MSTIAPTETHKYTDGSVSTLAPGRISEGIVIRPSEETFSRTCQDRLIGKYKGPLYAERKSLRDADLGALAKYVTEYDLIGDFITAERVRHVLQGALATSSRRVRG